MLGTILNPEQEEILRDERRWLTDLRGILVELGAAAEILEPLDESVEQLDELFLLVVVGEFNSGKSSLINSLLGRRVLTEGVTPTTQKLHLLRWAESPLRESGPGGIEIVGEPAELLRQLHLVDTPGTNAVIREHQALTERYVPRSDLVLFVTSSDRPFSESERAFLERIRDWGKKVVLVVNKVDLLETEAERAEVEGFVRRHARDLLALDPPVFLVSARRAMRALEGSVPAANGDPPALEGLESFVRDHLDSASRIRLKLLNPLGVGQRILGDVISETEARGELLASDLRLLEDLDRQTEIYRKDMEDSIRMRLADIENELWVMEERGRAFLDRKLRIARMFDLFDRKRIGREFEAEAVADAPQVIERKVLELAEWLVAQDLRQWQAVSRHLESRAREHRERIVGGLGAEFHDDRHHVISSVRGAAQRVVESYDRSAEAREIADDARNTIAGSMALEAAGLGALVAALASTAIADVSGIVAASVLATVGLLVIPARRRAAKRELAERVGELRSGLLSALRGSLQGEMTRSMDRLGEAVAPYSRFVRAERERIDDARDRLRAVRHEGEGLQARIEAG